MTLTLMPISDRALPYAYGGTLLSEGASPAPQIRSPYIPPNTRRIPIKHLLIGAPPAIHHTIHRLHQLHYAEAGLWSSLLTIPDRQIILAPDPGDAMAILVRYLTL